MFFGRFIHKSVVGKLLRKKRHGPIYRRLMHFARPFHKVHNRILSNYSKLFNHKNHC